MNDTKQGAVQTPINSPGDAQLLEGQIWPYCSCVGRGADDPHHIDCKFWQFILRRRIEWRDANVIAWSCYGEAHGRARCMQWCGTQQGCPAAIRGAQIDLRASYTQLLAERDALRAELAACRGARSAVSDERLAELKLWLERKWNRHHEEEDLEAGNALYELIDIRAALSRTEPK